MQNKLHVDLAQRLASAERTRQSIAPLTTEYPTLTEADAYAIQNKNAENRLAHGEKLLGYKIGLTSKVVQKRFGVDKPDYGHLFESMRVENNATVDLNTLMQPKIEGEVAFVMKQDLPLEKVTVAQVVDAVDYVTCAFEIVDSRIRDWQIKWADTIADNGSAARFVLANEKVLLKDLDLSFVGMALSRAGEVEVTGSGAAVMGNPLNAVTFLANELGKFGKQIKAGDIILSGSLAGMLDVKTEETFECEMWKLGRVNVSFKRSGK